MHDLLRQKITHLFNLMDRNHDGFLDRSDFELLGGAYGRAFGLSSGTPEHQEIVDRQLQGWDHAVSKLDADGDGRVTLQEYVVGTGHLASDEASFEQFVVAMARSALSLSDRDGDGRLNLAEITAQLGVHGASAAEAAESFSRLDRDGDGAVTIEELVENTREYFHSTDPGARGNWILGPGWQRAARA